MRRLIEDMLAEQAALARAIMDFAGRPGGPDNPERATLAVTAWTAARADPVRAAKRTVEEVEKPPAAGPSPSSPSPTRP